MKGKLKGKFLWVVWFLDKKTAIKRFNVVSAETNDEATRLCNLFGYGSRFEWLGTESYSNVEDY